MSNYMEMNTHILHSGKTGNVIYCYYFLVLVVAVAAVAVGGKLTAT